MSGRKREKWSHSYSVFVDVPQDLGDLLWDLITRYMWALQYVVNHIHSKIQWVEEEVQRYYTIIVTPELKTEYKEYRSYDEKVESTRRCLEIQGKTFQEFRKFDKKSKKWLVGFRVYYTTKRRAPALPAYPEIYDELRPKLLEMWKKTPYAAHYVDSIIQYAYNTVMKSWQELYEMGQARKKPTMKKRTIYLKNSLCRTRNGELVITLIPRKRYLKVPIDGQWFLQRVKDHKLGAVLIKELVPREKYRVILQYTKEKESFEPKAYLSIDLNMDTIDLLLHAPSTTLWITIDWSELIRWIRKNHKKKSRVQKKLAHAKRKNLRRALEPLSTKYHNHTRDAIRKIATYIVELARTYNALILVEDLEKQQMFNKSKNWNRKLSYRLWKLLVQELKARWYVDDKVDPRNTTRTCSKCGSQENNSPRPDRKVYGVWPRDQQTTQRGN